MGNYEDSAMRTMLMKKLNGQADKIIPVACYKASLFGVSQFKMFYIFSLRHANFMDTDGIYAVFSEYFCNLWTQIFIKIIFQRLSLIRKGCFL